MQGIFVSNSRKLLRAEITPQMASRGLTLREPASVSRTRRRLAGIALALSRGGNSELVNKSSREARGLLGVSGKTRESQYPGV
jgi:hypothetical protein